MRAGHGGFALAAAPFPEQCGALMTRRDRDIERLMAEREQVKVDFAHAREEQARRTEEHVQAMRERIASGEVRQVTHLSVLLHGTLLVCMVSFSSFIVRRGCLKRSLSES